ncbi:MAG: nucleoside triphosphate pyrophosphohydrolase [Alphaproteobacteria bacterium]|nr:nucleoside triphosphate pyrophosphohydrolase [Alphaproteobacteria bacterium]
MPRDLEHLSAVSDLLALMARLRDPVGGCPWDIEQDFRSIAPHTIEEAYEVADAVERGDMEDLKDELGDLLLQIVFHAQMATEEGMFTFADVARHVTDKMIHRHPHVFGNETATTGAEVLNTIWEAQKDKEKKRAESDSALDDVTRALPAMMRAQKLQKRAARVGFSWPDPAGAEEKLAEELAELEVAVVRQDEANIHEEVGDALFALIGYGRMLGVDCETALRDCNRKFERRFKGLERELKSQNKTIRDASLDQLLRIWTAQKEIEKAG